MSCFCASRAACSHSSFSRRSSVFLATSVSRPPADVNHSVSHIDSYSVSRSVSHSVSHSVSCNASCNVSGRGSG